MSSTKIILRLTSNPALKKKGLRHVPSVLFKSVVNLRTLP